MSHIIYKLDRRIDRTHQTVKNNVSNAIKEIQADFHSDISEINKKIDKILISYEKKNQDIQEEDSEHEDSAPKFDMKT